MNFNIFFQDMYDQINSWDNLKNLFYALLIMFILILISLNEFKFNKCNKQLFILLVLLILLSVYDNFIRKKIEKFIDKKNKENFFTKNDYNDKKNSLEDFVKELFNDGDDGETGEAGEASEEGEEDRPLMPNELIDEPPTVVSTVDSNPEALPLGMSNGSIGGGKIYHAHRINDNCHIDGSCKNSDNYEFGNIGGLKDLVSIFNFPFEEIPQNDVDMRNYRFNIFNMNDRNNYMNTGIHSSSELSINENELRTNAPPSYTNPLSLAGETRSGTTERSGTTGGTTGEARSGTTERRETTGETTGEASIIRSTLPSGINDIIYRTTETPQPANTIPNSSEEIETYMNSYIGKPHWNEKYNDN